MNIRSLRDIRFERACYIFFCEGEKLDPECEDSLSLYISERCKPRARVGRPPDGQLIAARILSERIPGLWCKSGYKPEAVPEPEPVENDEDECLADELHDDDLAEIERCEDSEDALDHADSVEDLDEEAAFI